MSMRQAGCVAWAALLLAVACSRSIDPCPPQTVREGDRCMVLPDASVTRTPVMRTPPQTSDAATPQRSEAGTPQREDASAPDDFPEAGLEPTTDGGEAMKLCPQSEVQRWSALLMSNALVPALNACILNNPACLSGTCNLAECLRATLNMKGCADCISQQVSCMAAYCRQECGPKSSSSQCLSCGCEVGCTELFSSCANTNTLVCPVVPDAAVPPPLDPEPAGPLAPELIMTVIGAAG